MISAYALRPLVQYVESNSQLRGCGIGYSGQGVSEVIKAADPSLPLSLQTWILILEEDLPSPVSSSQRFSPAEVVYSSGTTATSQATTTQPAPAPRIAEPARSRWTGLINEAPSVIMSCGSAVITGGSAAAGVMAAPVTAGASTVVTYAMAAGAVASAAQCGIALGRVGNVLWWNDERNERLLDNESWYQWTTNSLDAIALMGDVVGLRAGARALIQMSRSTGRPIYDLLKSYTKAQRRQIMRDLNLLFERDSPELFAAIIRDGKIPTLYSSDRIVRGVAVQLWGAAAAGIDFVSSATAGGIRNLSLWVANF